MRYLTLFLFSSVVVFPQQRIPTIESEVSGLHVRNPTHDHRIVGISILVNNSVHFVLDGLDNFWVGIPPGEQMPLSGSGFGGISLGRSEAADTASVDWVLYDDGEFYGSSKDAQLLTKKATVRRRFYDMVSNKLDGAEYAASIKSCIDTPSCDDLGKDSKELTYLWMAADSYERHMRRFGSRGAEYLRNVTVWHQAYPKVRHVGVIRKNQTMPQDGANGWAFSLFSASCKNSPGYFISQPGEQCRYATVDNQYRAFGDPPELSGYKASSSASCNNINTGARGKPINSKFEHAVYTLTTDPNAIIYIPRHYVTLRIATNYNQQLREGWLGDSTFFAVAYGYPERAGSSADVHGGDTWCTLFFDGPPYGPFANNTISGYPGPPGANYFPAVLLLDYNTKQNAAGNGYGFFIANYEEAWTCGDPIPFVTPYEQEAVSPGTIWTPMPIVRNDGAHGLGVAIGCLHVGLAAGGPQGNQCNPNQSWCCCMATYNNWDLCVAYGLTPIDGCGGPAAAAFSTPNGSVALTSTVGRSTSIAHSRIGVSRYNTAWLLDKFGENSYIAGETVYLIGFAPPGGVLSTDIPVTGDWNGSGSSHVGYYRPTTGQWFLDSNGNGIWDQNDSVFNFGGLPGDIPVTGDWDGQHFVDCPGIYRHGLWILDANCNYAVDDLSDFIFGFGGAAGDVPVVGKWNNQMTQVGVVRPYNGQGAPFLWLLDGAPNYYPQQYHYIQQQFVFGGIYGDKYITGDWLGTGIDRAGIYRNGVWIEDTIGAHTYDTAYAFGGTFGDVPVVGKW